MKKEIIKEWLKAMRLSVTIPAGLLVHIAARVAHEQTNWWLVLEIFFVASLAMIHNDYYDRVNDCKKGKTFAFEHAKQFQIIVLAGWSIVLILAFTCLWKYWIVLLPVIIVSALYSYTRKIMFVQTICVAATSASPFLIGHLDKANELNSINFALFWVVFICIYAREMAKNIEDAKTDVGYKITPVSTTIPILKTSLDTYLQGAGGLMVFCFMILIAVTSKTLDSLPKIESIFISLTIMGGLFAGMMWCAKGSVPGLMIIDRIEDKTDEEVFDDVKLGKQIFDVTMLFGITGALILL